MPTNTIVFKVNDRNARAGFNRLKQEVDSLDSEFSDTRTEAQRAGGAIDRLGDRSRTAARDVDRLGDEARKSRREIINFGNAASGANRGFGTLTQSLGGARGLLAGLGFAVAARELYQFGRASVEASVQIDSFTRALAALEGNSQIAETRIRQLQMLSDEPGLRFRGAVQGALALRAIGTEAELTTRILRELGNAAAFTDTGGEFERGLLGLRQIIARGRISQEELNQITENISIASKVIQEKFGTVLAEDIQAQLDEAGQDINDFVEQLISGFERLERFPIDAASVKLKNLSNSFFELQAAIGDLLLPTVAAAAGGLTKLFDGIAEGTRNVANFFDVVDEQHQALLNASESAREFAARLADIDTAAGQNTAVNARIQTLHRVRNALRIEQSQLSDSTQEYRKYAESIRDAANELDLLRAIRNAGTDDSNTAQLLAQRTDALSRTNAAIEDYERRLEKVREVSVGRTNPSIQQLERALERQRTTAASLRREIELLKGGFQDFIPPAAVQTVENYALAIARLRAQAEDTQRTLADSSRNQVVVPNFRAALAASNAYYAQRIQHAEEALAKEQEGTSEFNALQVQIFDLGRQRLNAERQLEAQRSNILQTFARERRRVEEDTNNAIVNSVLAGFSAIRRGAAELARERVVFAQQIAAIPAVASPEAQYGNFTSQLRRDFEETAQSGRSLLNVMNQIVRFSVGDTFLDLDDLIPDPGVRQQQIDDQIAAQVRGQQTLTDIRQDALEQGRQFLRGILRDEQREIQRSINANARQYRQFANLVSNTFLDLATGRVQSFSQVAAQFIQQSLRIVARAIIEHQIRLRLSNQLADAQITNINRVAAAQQAASAGGLGGLGNIPGLGNLSGLSGLLSGGGAALGVSALLFPQEIRNISGGITDTIGNLLSNVASVPDRTFGPQQILLKIGEQEARDISDIQDDLRQEDRL